MLTQIFAVILSSFGIVLIKPILSEINNSIETQLWVTFLGFFQDLFLHGLFILFKKINWNY